MTDEKVDEKITEKPTEKEDQEASSSDEEETPPPGELDKPIVILYEKRAKKEVKRFNPIEKKEKEPKSAKKSTTPGLAVPSGKGAALESMSEVIKNFANESDQDLKVIFTVLFGHKRVKLNEVRKTLRKWHGWDVDPDSQEHQVLQEGVGNMTSDNLKWAMDVLDISRRVLTKKEALVDKMCEWCMKPVKFGSGSEKEKKNKTTPSKKTTSVKTTPKKTKKTEAETPSKKKRKAEKDPNKPKKPQSAFFLFLNKNREEFTKKLGSKNPAELAKTASEKWKAMKDSDKTEFAEAAEKLKAEYDVAMEKYNKEQGTNTEPKAKVAKKTSDKKSTKKEAKEPKSTPPTKKAKVTKPKEAQATKTTEPMPSDKDIEKYLIKLIKKANLEKLTMKQVLSKVAEKYPQMNISTKKSFIKSKVKELIQ